MHAIDSIYFYVFSILSLTGALAVVLSKSPIRSAMGLLLVILSVAALFLRLRAEFLAAIQLIVYAGAIVVLFLFVIMLLGPSATVPSDRRGLVARAFGGVLFGICGIGAMALVARAGLGASPPPPLPEAGFGGIEAFGSVLFSDALVPFEISSALLMVAVVGAIAVARGRQGIRTLSSAERSAGGEPAPVEPRAPGGLSGVFSHEVHLGDAKERSA